MQTANGRFFKCDFWARIAIFAFDTGCTATIVDVSLQGQLGKQLGLTTADTPGGDLGLPIFKAPDVTLGGLRLKSKEAGCADLKILSEPIGCPLEGVIGMAPLEKHIFELDLAGGTVRIYDRVPDNAKRDGKVFPLRMDFGCPVIRATLPDGSAEDFLIDSGGGGASLSLSDHVFERFADGGTIRNRHRTNTFSAAGRGTTEVGLLDTFVLGGFKHNRLSVDKSTGMSAIGWEYLRRYVTVFDLPGGRLYLRPSPHYHAAEQPLGKSGLDLMLRDGSIVVGNHCPLDSPAGEAGLLKDDRILSVNGKPVLASSLFGLPDFSVAKGIAFELKLESRESNH